MGSNIHIVPRTYNDYRCSYLQLFDSMIELQDLYTCTTVRFHLKLSNKYISCTPRIETADVGLGYFPNTKKNQNQWQAQEITGPCTQYGYIRFSYFYLCLLSYFTLFCLTHLLLFNSSKQAMLTCSIWPFNILKVFKLSFRSLFFFFYILL